MTLSGSNRCGGATWSEWQNCGGRAVCSHRLGRVVCGGNGQPVNVPVAKTEAVISIS